MIHWLIHVLGLDDASGPAYLFWSGIVGDLGLFSAMGVYYKHHNCPHAWCWRIGRYPIAGGTLRTCRRHHPDPIPRGLRKHHIQAIHDAALSSGGRGLFYSSRDDRKDP